MHAKVPSRMCRNTAIQTHPVAQCTLGWSDLALFSFFKNPNLSADQVGIFLENQFQKIAFLATGARQSFHFQKSQGP